MHDRQSSMVSSPGLLPGSAECAEKVLYVSQPLCAHADDLEAESVVDREHGPFGERVLRPHPHSLRPLVPGPFKLCDELGIDGHIADIEILPRSGLHDVVKRAPSS